MNDLPLRPDELNLSPVELARRLAGMMRLIEVTPRLAASIDLTEILQAVADEARLALGCDRASLYQYDAASRELFTRVVTELEISEIRHGVERGISGYVARNLETASVPDPANDARWNSSVDCATGYHTQNILAAPLTSPNDGQLLGVLELINKLDGPFDRFDEELALAFCQHAAVALDRARLIDALRKRDEVEASLNVARDVQRSFMPRELPSIDHYEIASWWYPNEAIGGDYCDVVRLRDGRHLLVMADVSGHGLGPSLLMASVRAALRALILKQHRTDVLLSSLARALSHDLQDGRFITMVLAALDNRHHAVEFANAGHGPALHFHKQTGHFSVLAATGVPLGVIDDPQYVIGPNTAIQVGDLLILCTDGIVEAMDEKDEQFGRERLERLVRKHATAPVTEIVASIAEAVTAHYVGESPPDDLTILALRRNE